MPILVHKLPFQAHETTKIAQNRHLTDLEVVKISKRATNSIFKKAFFKK